jgi:hypothetical protein
MLVLAGMLSAAVVLDRVAVVVGKQVIKESDLLRDLRVTEFLNGERPDFSPSAKRKAADRLIDQLIIRNEIRRGAYAPAPASESGKMLEQIEQQRFGGSKAKFQQALARYGLMEDELRMQLQWQLDVLTFIDQRFRPGVLVTDDEVKSYYDQHLAALRITYPDAKTFQEMAPKVRSLLEGQKLNQEFDAWLRQQRGQAQIEYVKGAFQ